MTTTPLDLPQAVRDVDQASARLMWLALREADSSLSTEEIASSIGVSKSSVKYIASVLRQDGLIETKDHPVDGRRTLYTVSEPPTTDAELEAVS